MKQGVFQTFALALAGLLFLATPARAIVIGFDPAAQTTAPGLSVDVALTISGLGDGVAPSLGTFDLDVSFDTAVVGLNSVTFGDPVLGDQLDLFGLGSITFPTLVGGTVNLFELSLDLVDDLNDLQAPAFTLAVLNFQALAVGTSALSASVNALGDALGDPLIADLTSGSIAVAQPSIGVPEPASDWLLAIGFAGLAILARRRRAVV